MSPKIPPHRSTAKAGVNAARTLFESFNYVFQEVELGNDFGKDAYVDLVNGREVTGICIALQIKSGDSFRREEGYAFPIGEHDPSLRHPAFEPLPRSNRRHPASETLPSVERKRQSTGTDLRPPGNPFPGCLTMPSGRPISPTQRRRAGALHFRPLHPRLASL